MSIYKCFNGAYSSSVASRITLNGGNAGLKHTPEATRASITPEAQWPQNWRQRASKLEGSR